MESLTKSHIYAASKTIIYLLLQFFILLFCLILTLNLTQNKNSLLSIKILPYEISNLTYFSNWKNLSIKTSQKYEEKYKIEEKEYILNIKIKNVKNREISNIKRENNSNLKTARASWYGSRFFGKRTANGELFTKNIISFAHRSMSFGTKVKFYYNGNIVIAHCNDRGPFIKGREFDLSLKSAKILGLKGVKLVKYEILDDLEEENMNVYEFCSILE